MAVLTRLALFASATLLLALTVRADEAPAARVAAFQGDRPAAVSLTFDDGLLDDSDIIAPLLAKYGLHATFFIIADRVGDKPDDPNGKGHMTWDQIRALAAAGHEIGNHSWTHKQLPKVDDAELAVQVDKAYAKLKEEIGTAPLTFCYPGNGRNDHVREYVLKTHVAARDFQVEVGGPTWTLASGTAQLDASAEKHKWVVTMTHAIVNGYHPFTDPKQFEAYLAYLHDHPETFWVDTFANVARYTQEREKAVLKAEASAPDKTVVTLTCPLDARYIVPLTVVLPVPAGVKGAKVQLANQTTPAAVTIRGATAMFDLVPNSGACTVTWQP